MSKKQNRLAPANAEKLVYIFHNLRAIRKMENVDLNTRYVADVEAMHLEHCIGHGIEYESLDSSNTTDSNLYHALFKPSVTQMRFNWMWIIIDPFRW